MSELSNEERTELRQVLQKHFNIGELKNLAFDLGINYQNFPNIHNEFSREFILHFERHNQLSTLVSEIVKQRPNLDLSHLLAKLPPSSPNIKLQVILPKTDLKKANDLLEELASQLGYPPEQIQIIGAAWGSMRLLFSIQEEFANMLIKSPIQKKDLTEDIRKIPAWKYEKFHYWLKKYNIKTITAFSVLESSSQLAWQIIVELSYTLVQDLQEISELNSLIYHHPILAWEPIEESQRSNLTVRTTIPQEKPVHLNHRELDILELMSSGLKNNEIGINLSIKTTTVRMYVRRIYSKLNVNSRGEAVSIYKQNYSKKKSDQD